VRKEKGVSMMGGKRHKSLLGKSVSYLKKEIYVSGKVRAKHILIILLGMLLLSILTVPAAANSSLSFHKIKVMTQNLYVGAEIQSLAAAQTPEEFLAGVQAALDQITKNNFPARAAAIAAEIAAKMPHLVGLQEVYNFTINGFNVGPPFSDYLADLRDALKARGAFYKAVAVVNNFDMQIDIEDIGIVRVLDRDVILARSDVAPTVTNVDPADLCSGRESEDGCNYLVVASVNSPILGPVAFKRGFVAVDAHVGTLPVRFVSTHLEVRDVDPTNPLSPLIQAAQASELVGLLSPMGPLSTEDRPVILVGDFNSSQEDPIRYIDGHLLVPPYKQIRFAHFVDIWNRNLLKFLNPDGFTCCQAANLQGESSLYERVDLIFVHNKFGEWQFTIPGPTLAVVVGDKERDKTETDSPLWPSDHGGVAATMFIPTF
jgi:hypothetical protein